MCIFSTLLVRSNVFSIPSLYFTYLVLGLAFFLRSIFCPGFLSFFLTFFFFFLIKKGVTVLMARGNIHLAHAVKWPCGAVVSSQVGRAVPPTCVALTAGCTAGCPERRLANKTAWKELVAACSSPQPQDSHKVFLQWECVFGSFLPGCSFSLLAWHHLPHNHFPQPFTGRTVCLDL